MWQSWRSSNKTSLGAAGSMSERHRTIYTVPTGGVNSAKLFLYSSVCIFSPDECCSDSVGMSTTRLEQEERLRVSQTN